MSAHTPGPWSVNASLGHRIYTEGKGCTLIATPGYLRDGGAEVANARLIAAAPDLLAELETINSLACYATEANASARLDALLEIGKRARAAIAKVEAT